MAARPRPRPARVLADARRRGRCPAVARLRAAGAAARSKRTNMSEFAFLGRGHQPAPRHAGQRRHRGARRHAAHPRRLDLRRRRLGGRRRRLGGAGLRHRRLDPHPGALQGLVGSRAPRGWCPPTARSRCRPRWTPSAPITRTCAMRCTVHEVLAARVTLAAAAGRAAFRRADHADARRAGARPGRRSSARSHAAAMPARASREIRSPQLAELAALNAAGGFSAARAGPGTAGCWRPGRPVRPARRRAHPPRREDEAPTTSSSPGRGATGSRAPSRHGRAIRLRRHAEPHRAPHRPGHRPSSAATRAFFAANGVAAQPQRDQLPRRLRALLPCHAAGEMPVGLMGGRCAARRPRCSTLRWPSKRRCQRRGRRDILSMRIAVIGAGIVGVTTAYELAAAGPRSPSSNAAAASPPRPASPMPAWWRPATSRPGLRPACPRRCCACSAGRAGARARQPRPGPARLDVALVARLPHRGLAGQPHAHAAPGGVQPPPAARADQARAAARVRTRAATRCCCAANPTSRPRGRAEAAHRAGQPLPPRRCGSCRELEPALNPDTALDAGVHLPDDEVGNCRQLRTCCATRPEAGRAGAPMRCSARAGRAAAGGAPPCRWPNRRSSSSSPHLRRTTGRPPEPAPPRSGERELRCQTWSAPRWARPSCCARWAAPAARACTATRSPRLRPRTAPPSGAACRADGRTLQGGHQPHRPARARGRQRRSSAARWTKLDPAPSKRSTKVLDDWFPGAGR